jgi:hypothetical protein
MKKIPKKQNHKLNKALYYFRGALKWEFYANSAYILNNLKLRDDFKFKKDLLGEDVSAYYLNAANNNLRKFTSVIAKTSGRHRFKRGDSPYSYNTKFNIFGLKKGSKK